MSRPKIKPALVRQHVSITLPPKLLRDKKAEASAREISFSHLVEENLELFPELVLVLTNLLSWCDTGLMSKKNPSVIAAKSTLAKSIYSPR